MMLGPGVRPRPPWKMGAGENQGAELGEVVRNHFACTSRSRSSSLKRTLWIKKFKEAAALQTAVLSPRGRQGGLSLRHSKGAVFKRFSQRAEMRVPVSVTDTRAARV